MRASILASLTALALSGACVSAPNGSDDGAPCAGKCDDGGGSAADARVCVAIRGNGPRLTAHWGALARILEHYGLLDGAAGGSSGSISSFLLESVQMNPAIYDCGGVACSEREAAGRAALLFKSMQGYLEVYASSDEVRATIALADIARRIQDRGIDALLEEDPDAGVAALQTLLGSPELRDLVNPEALELLATSPDPAYHARDLIEGAQAAVSFQATTDRIFLRPGLVRFPAVVQRLGRVASFYAGYAPADLDAMTAFLDACAEPGRGLPWREVAMLPAGDRTCGERFAALVADYRARLLADEVSYASRLDEPVGAVLPALVTTSVLEGDAVTTWQAARAAYLRAEPYTFDIDFADVAFGYWGRADHLARVAANPHGFDDAKTAKFRSLGEATWREVLGYSPAEPGLDRALELPDGRVSAGGWSDLQPVLVLKNLGCDEVVYVTRRGGAGWFITGIAGMLGMDADEDRALFDLSTTDSAYGLSLASADGVWCTNWDAPSPLDLDAMTDDGWNAPLETTDPVFVAADDPYANISPRLGIAGCTLGVVE